MATFYPLADLQQGGRRKFDFFKNKNTL